MKKVNVKGKNILVKLRSQDGASMIISLGIFLVAVIISLSLISIGMTSAKLSSAQMEDEQAYLVVSSAMRLFEGEMEAVEIEAEQTANADGTFPDDPFEGAIISSELGSDDPLDDALIKLLCGTSKSLVIYSPTEARADGSAMIMYDTDVKFSEEPGVKLAGSPDPIKYVVRADFSAKAKSGAVSPSDYTKSAFYYPYMGEIINYGLKEVDGETVTVPVSRTTTIRWKVYVK